MFENKTVKELIFLIKNREISIKELNKYYLEKMEPYIYMKEIVQFRDGIKN